MSKIIHMPTIDATGLYTLNVDDLSGYITIDEPFIVAELYGEDIDITTFDTQPKVKADVIDLAEYRRNRNVRD